VTKHSLFIGFILLLFGGDAIGQRAIADFNLSLENDSIRLIEEFYPSIDMERYVLDLSSVDAACAKSLQINEQGDLLSLYNKSQLLSAYRIGKDGMRIEYEPEIKEIFSIYGEVSMTNVSQNYFIDFPLENEEVKKNQEQVFEVVINNPSSRFGNYDQLSFQVYITQSLEIAEREKINYPYGQRLSVPVYVENRYSMSDVYGSLKSQKTKIDTDIFSQKLPSNPIQYYYMLNHHKGILLAVIKAIDNISQSVQVFQEMSDRTYLSECMSDQATFQLYPNPSYGAINIMLNDPSLGDYRIEVFSVIGKLLYGESLNHEQAISKFSITLPSLPKGTYLYSIIDPDGQRMYTRRLTIVGF
jgi:hypothetical protein